MRRELEAMIGRLILGKKVIKDIRGNAMCGEDAKICGGSGGFTETSAEP
jgi:hypothetical protein